MRFLAMADKTTAKHLEPYKWRKGVSANPAGRPKGSRNKIAESFLADVLAEWEAHGAVAISDMREKNPGDFCKMVASLLPKDINVSLGDNLSELSDDELIGQLRDLASVIAPFIGGGDSGVEAAGGAEEPTRFH